MSKKPHCSCNSCMNVRHYPPAPRKWISQNLKLPYQRNMLTFHFVLPVFVATGVAFAFTGMAFTFTSVTFTYGSFSSTTTRKKKQYDLPAGTSPLLRTVISATPCSHSMPSLSHEHWYASWPASLQPPQLLQAPLPSPSFPPLTSSVLLFVYRQAPHAVCASR